MFSPTTRLHINETDVTATVIDGEAIMINLTSGVYYSTEGVGARIWQLAASGASSQEVSEVISQEYNVPHTQVTEDVVRLINQFVEEKLLLPHSYASVAVLPAAEAAQAAYTAPQLEIYREMGHLLALDPPMPGLENIAWDETSQA